MLTKGKTACVVLAGGQGTRLAWEGPKGTFPITPIHHKSLFQLIAEKCLFASQHYGVDLPLAFMTSEENDSQTRQFFKAHNNFGLKATQLHFFVQESLPLLEIDGTPIPQCKASAGNGSFFASFMQSALHLKWQNIEHILVIPVDNPLSDPFDSQLLEFHEREGSEVSLIVSLKRGPNEKVGSVVQEGDRVRIVEYTEGHASHWANLGLFCFSRSFVEKMGKKSLPLHLARKFNALLGREVIKQETFIFDVLPFAQKTSILKRLREECFAPLKNFSGKDSIADVQAALVAKDRAWFEKMSGKKLPDGKIELSPHFYYLSDEQWADVRAENIENYVRT